MKLTLSGMLGVMFLTGFGLFLNNWMRRLKEEGHGFSFKFSGKKRTASNSTATEDLGASSYGDGIVLAPRVRGEGQAADEVEETAAETAHEMLSNLLVIYLMARPNTSFQGYELLQSLLSVDLRYGSKKIFHYHSPNDPDETWFSVAQATEPGIFDLNNMGGLACKGLVMFMDAAETEYPQQAFEQMLATAHQLADDLGGIIQDDARKRLLEKTINQYKKRIEDIISA